MLDRDDDGGRNQNAYARNQNAYPGTRTHSLAPIDRREPSVAGKQPERGGRRLPALESAPGLGLGRPGGARWYGCRL